VVIALTLERLGRSGALLTLPEPERSRFLAAARRLDAGAFADAAEILREIGARQFESECRMLAAREATAAGDEATAEQHAERGRELLRQLDARFRLSELEAGLRTRSAGS
jgi:hypothetical protein